MGARDRAVRLPVPATPPPDVFSFSEPSKIVVRHIDLDLTVNIEEHRIAGTATLEVQNFSGTKTLILDTRELEIASVTRDGHIPAAYTLGIPTSNGTPLTIEIVPATHSVTIDYTATRPAAIAWRSAAQTLGKVAPFVYSNNEPAGARSWLPIQDTPTVRVTYDATLRVPSGLLALMSAENNPTESNASGIYTFHMGSSVPAYLIAFAVGRLQFRPFDSRSGVYAEPELIERAATNLRYIPEVLASTESLLGTHPWPRYDILMMPPDYRGGMENACLNFIYAGTANTTTVSQLITHELSHSWAGDMVTLATWSDTWLNEGMASYLEYRLLEPFASREAVDKAWTARRDSFNTYAIGATPRSSLLHLPLTAADDPNQVFNAAAYIKGSLFFHELEAVIGREAFDGFLRAYLARFAWHFVDDARFIDFLRATVLTPDLEQRLNLMEWIYEPGLPASAVKSLSAPVAARMHLPRPSVFRPALASSPAR